MPAPSTKQIYNFKGNFSAAALAILRAAGIDDSYLERTDEFVAQKARLEVSFDLGEAANVENQPDGSHVYDFYSARLRLRIVTARRDDMSSAVAEVRDLHDEFVCTALDAFEERKAPFTAENLPYYNVQTIRPLGTRSDLDLTYLEDFTDVDLFLEFGIKPDQWPA